LTADWEHIKTEEGKWNTEEGTAGGSPNNATFINNPQYALQFNAKETSNLLMEITQQDSTDSIGFLVIRQEGSPAKLTEYNISEDDIFCKPEGWKSALSVPCRTSVDKSDIDDSGWFLIIPSTFKPNIDKTFQLRIYSDKEFTLTKL